MAESLAVEGISSDACLLIAAKARLKTRQKIGPITNIHTDQTVLNNLESTVMTQLSLKQGLKTFGKAGVDAVEKELKLINPDDLTPRQALDVLYKLKKLNS